MSNPNKARGDRWERAIVDFLRPWFGRNVIRPRQEGFVDIGDVHISPWVIQAKDEGKHAFASYLRDAEKQAEAAGESFGAAVVKRRQAGPGLAYALMTLATFRRVVARLRRAEALLLRANPDLFDQHMAETKKENETP